MLSGKTENHGPISRGMTKNPNTIPNNTRAGLIQQARVQIDRKLHGSKCTKLSHNIF